MKRPAILTDVIGKAKITGKTFWEVGMKQKSQWSVRRLACPEGSSRRELLIEWTVEKGKKVLRSVSCDSSELSHYSGSDCKWVCIEKMSGAKKPKK